MADFEDTEPLTWCECVKLLVCTAYADGMKKMVGDEHNLIDCGAHACQMCLEVINSKLEMCMKCTRYFAG